MLFLRVAVSIMGGLGEVGFGQGEVFIGLGGLIFKVRGATFYDRRLNFL